MCLDGVYKITQLQVGAVPTGSPAGDSDRDVVLHVFAKDVLKRGSCRFQCMYEGLKQPSRGTVVVPMQGMVTNHIVLRGTYQTVPVTIYGFKLDSIAALKRCEESQKEDVYPLEYPVERSVSGVFLREHHVDAVGVWGNDTSSAEDILAAFQVAAVDEVFDTLWMQSVGIDGGGLADSLSCAVNRAVAWISAFLSTLHEGMVCKKYEVDMAHYGLDILAVAFLHDKVALDFVLHGGGLILRAIMSMRGLPGSFYNKTVALIALLVRQAGVDACRMLTKETFSKCRLLKGEAFFPSRDTSHQTGKAKRSRGDGGDTKQSRKKQKVSKKRTSKNQSGNDASSSIARFLDQIDGQEYAKYEKGFWRDQGDLRDTLADVLMGHMTRFKPNSIQGYLTFIIECLDLYKSCRNALKALREMCSAMSSSGMEHTGADLVDSIRILTSQVVPKRSHRLCGWDNSLQVQEDLSISGRNQISVVYLEHYRIAEELCKTVDLVSQRMVDVEDDDTCRKVCGLLSVVLVEFCSCVLKNPEFLSSSSCQRLLEIFQNKTLSSHENPHKYSFNILRYELESYMKTSLRLAQLAAVDWSTLENTVVHVEDVSPAFIYNVKVLVEKCIDSVDAYSKAALGNDVPDMATQKSFELAQSVLLELVVTSHPLALKVLLGRSSALFESLDMLIKSNVLVDSNMSLAQSQIIRGGLLAFTQCATNGIMELVKILGGQLPWIRINDNTEKGMDQSEYFETVDAVCFGNALAVTMSWDEIRLLLDDPERLGQVLASIQILKYFLQNDEGASVASQAISAGALPLRCLVCATEIFSASVADNMWLNRVGTAMDILEMSSNKSLAIRFMESVTACVCSYLEHASKIGMKIDNLALLSALLKAHASVSIESQAMMDIAMQESNNSFSLMLRRIRWNLATCLRCWIDSPRMSPQVIPTALSGAISAPLENGCTVSFSPAGLLSISVLLGDVFPSEWPKPGYRNHLLSEEKRYRAALTEEIEGCIASFEHFVSCCIQSETVYLQSSAIRFLSKGAGLGGGMGSFLMGIVSSRFNDIISMPVLAAYVLYDMRRILEIMVPLLYQPAIKAAALDTLIPLNLANLVEKMIQQTSNPESVIDQKEFSSILTMTLECLTVLCDPSITLDVFEMRSSQSMDVLGKDAGSLISCSILDHIAVLGENIPLALNLLDMMVQNRRGRDNIQLGVIQLCMKSQEEHIEHPTNEQIIAASQWLVHQYKTIRSQSPDESIAFIFERLENILIETCVINHGDTSISPVEKARPAPARFAAVAKEASARGSPKQNVNRHLGGNYLDLMQDCESVIIFWKNQTLRKMHGSSAAAHAARLSKYIGWDIGEEMDKFCMADILHPWMTHPVRPLNEKMNAQAHDHDDSQEEFIQDEPEQEERNIHEGAQVSEVLETKMEDQPILEAPKVDLASLSEVLKTNAEDIEQPQEEEDEEIDLYADLYPSMDLPKVEEPETQIKTEGEPIENTVEPHASVQINFDEEENDEDSAEEEDDDEKEQQEEEEDEVEIREEQEDQPDAPPVNDKEEDKAYSEEELKDLLQDRQKVEELLANNPALLAQLKERLGQK